MTDKKIFNVVKLEPRIKENDELQLTVIDELERLLERAKEGEVIGIAFIAETKDSMSIDTGFTVRSIFRSLGGLAILQKELLEMIEDED